MDIDIIDISSSKRVGVTTHAEKINGRVAMLAIVFIIIVEGVFKHAVFKF